MSNKERLRTALEAWPDRWPPPDTLKYLEPLQVAIIAPWFRVIVDLETPITEEHVAKAQNRLRADGLLVGEPS